MLPKRVGIIVGGGPAPGTNGVIAATAIHAINCGCTVVGFHDGFEWLAQRYTDEQHQFTIPEAAHLHLQGGVILGTSRTDVTRDKESLDNSIAALKKLGMEAIVTIGGDDMVRSSAAIERETNGAIKVVQVPKSIDNDLFLPGAVPTLGYETARHVGVDLLKRIMEDARTTGRWYFAVMMGRPTGQLTLGIGKAASATCTIIPEEFGNKISLDDIADIVEGTIIKRRSMGRDFGVILLSEALVEHFDSEEVSELQDVDRDAQGNIRVTEIDLGRKVKNEVQMRLERRNIKVTIVDKSIGYELRCASPIPFDAEYARDLGFAAFKYLSEGGSNSMITIQGGEFQPVPFSEVLDPKTGQGRQRFVDVETESYRVARDYMVRIGPKDFLSDETIEGLARAGGMDKSEFLARFGKYSS